MHGFYLSSGAGTALAAGNQESLRNASLDGYYTNTAKVDTNTTILIGSSGGFDCAALWIFPISGIPQGSTIVKAVMRLRRAAGTQTAISVVWVGYDVDDATALAANEAAFAALARTTATVTQDIAAGEAGSIIDSPAITTVIQEITDRLGFGGGIGIIADKGAPDWGLATFAAVEHASLSEAILIVQYT